MSAPVYTVQRFCRHTRDVLEAYDAETPGRGLTRDEARALAARLREEDAEHEEQWGYQIATLPLDRQAEILDAEARAAAAAPQAGMPHAADRPAIDRVAAAGALVETIDLLAVDRERADEREHNLRIALRKWAEGALGTVDALAVLVADRHGCTVTFARECLYRPKSRGALDAAVAVYREHVANERAGRREAVAA